MGGEMRDEFCAEREFQRKRHSRRVGLNRNAAQFPTDTSKEGQITSELQGHDRDTLVHLKQESQDTCARLRQKLSLTLPFAKYKEIDADRSKAARLSVLIDREFARRKSIERERIGTINHNSNKTIDWPREFLSAAKVLLSHEIFSLLERATEERISEKRAHQMAGISERFKVDGPTEDF